MLVLIVDDNGASQSAYTVNADTFTLLSIPVDVTIISGPQTNARRWSHLNHVIFYLMWMEKWHQDAQWKKTRHRRQFDNEQWIWKMLCWETLSPVTCRFHFDMFYPPKYCCRSSTSPLENSIPYRKTLQDSERFRNLLKKKLYPPLYY